MHVGAAAGSNTHGGGLAALLAASSGAASAGNTLGAAQGGGDCLGASGAARARPGLGDALGAVLSGLRPEPEFGDERGGGAAGDEEALVGAFRAMAPTLDALLQDLAGTLPDEPPALAAPH